MDRFTSKYDDDFYKRTPELIAEAEKYAVEVLNDGELLELYELQAEEKGCSVYEAAFNDFCTPPIILGIFYHRLPYSRIVIRVLDDHLVTDVYCVIQGIDSDYHCDGMAEYNDAQKCWEYRLKPLEDEQILASVLAHDYPGNQNYLVDELIAKD